MQEAVVVVNLPWLGSESTQGAAPADKGQCIAPWLQTLIGMVRKEQGAGGCDEALGGGGCWWVLLSPACCSACAMLPCCFSGAWVFWALEALLCCREVLCDLTEIPSPFAFKPGACFLTGERVWLLLCLFRLLQTGAIIESTRLEKVFKIKSHHCQHCQGHR